MEALRRYNPEDSKFHTQRRENLKIRLRTIYLKFCKIQFVACLFVARSIRVWLCSILIEICGVNIALFEFYLCKNYAVETVLKSPCLTR
jgi:hypothetical protein